MVLLIVYVKFDESISSKKVIVEAYSLQVSLLGTLQNIAGWNCYDNITNEGTLIVSKLDICNKQLVH